MFQIVSLQEHQVQKNDMHLFLFFYFPVLSNSWQSFYQSARYRFDSLQALQLLQPSKLQNHQIDPVQSSLDWQKTDLRCLHLLFCDFFDCRRLDCLIKNKQLKEVKH